MKDKLDIYYTDNQLNSDIYYCEENEAIVENVYVEVKDKDSK